MLFIIYRFAQYTSYLTNSSLNSSPNSPLDTQSQDEFGYNLQLDYWNLNFISGTFSAPSMNQILSKENIFNKSNKTSVKALFKSLQIFRTSFVKSNVVAKSSFNSSFGSNINETNDPLNNLTIIYLIKEKKQKST
jgi:hypothetical protein